MPKEEKKRPKNLQRLDDYNTLRRETKGFKPKTLPPEFSVKENLRNAAKDGVAKAKEVGSNVVSGVKNMKDKAGKALKALQNPTKAKEELEGKAYGGKVKKMSYGGKVKKMADGKMVTKKKKTTKVARRRGDGCAVKGKTRGRMV